MKILYIAIGIDQDMPLENGIYMKIRGQITALGDLGHKCDLVLVNGSLCKVIENFGEDEKVSQITTQSCFGKSGDYLLSYDMVYLRGALMPKSYSIIRLAKLKGCITIVEFPTYPIVSEIMSKARMKFTSHQYIKFAKSILGIITLKIFLLPYILYYTDICVAVSYEGYIYRKKAICIENGIDINMIPCKKSKEDKRWLTMIAVANISIWHGYDRVIRGLAKYNAAGMNDVRFHIVGEGIEKSNLERLAQELKLDSDTVCFLGHKVDQELTDEYDKADIGIGSLGMHRVKNLQSASSLKSREYCARGIPMILTDEQSSMETINNFILSVPSNDDEIDIFTVKKFFEALPNNEAMGQCLRNHAIKHFNWNAQMEKVVSAVRNLPSDI